MSADNIVYASLVGVLMLVCVLVYAGAQISDQRMEQSRCVIEQGKSEEWCYHWLRYAKATPR